MTEILSVTALIVTVGYLSACSVRIGDGPDSGRSSPDGSGTRREAAVDTRTDAGDAQEDGAIPDAGALAICNRENIVGSWAAVGLPAGASNTFTFNSDGTYAQSIVSATTTLGSFNEEGLKGTYTISGGVLTLTPVQLTCTPASPETTSCFMEDGELFDNSNGTTTTFAPYRATLPDAGSITLGCGDPFTPYPWMPNN